MSNLREPVFYTRMWNLWKTLGPGTFIETGTGPPPHCGLAVAHALEMRMFSCDLNRDFVASAQKRYPGAEVKHEDSVEFLPKACRHAGASRTVFFLDAHFPWLPEYENEDWYEESANATFDWPVMDELKIIRDTKGYVERDVILVDDLRCIADPQNPLYDPAMETSPLGQREYRFAEYLDVLSGTHHATVWPEFEGILVFYPKDLKVA